MLYLIGIGLERGDMTAKARRAAKKARKLFIETYTNRAYDPEGFKAEKVDREFVENGKLLELAEDSDVALFVSGDPLFATTHISLIKDARDRGIKVRVFHAPSVINAVARTGLSPYKIGHIVTLSTGLKSTREKLQLNGKAGLHTLCLLDPAITLNQGLEVLEGFGVEGPVVACQRLGMAGERIVYGKVAALQKLDFDQKPQCLVVPGGLHFFEKDFLETLRLHKQLS